MARSAQRRRGPPSMMRRGGGDPGGAWSPSALTSLRGWYRGDTVTLVGSDVDAWPDLSGVGNTMSAASSGVRPAWEAAGLGGQPSVLFDGASKWLRNTAFSLGGVTAPITFWMVAQSVSVTDFDNVISYGSGGRPAISQRPTGYAFFASGGTSSIAVRNCTTSALVVATWSATTQTIVSAITAGDASDSDANAGAAAADGQTMALGSSPTGSSAANVRLAEVGIMRAVITADELAALKAYAFARYSI